MLIVWGVAGFIGICLALLLIGWLISLAGDIYRAYFSKAERQHRAEMGRYAAWRAANPKAAKDADEHFGILDELER